MSDDSGFNLDEALESASESVSRVTSFLGIQREAYVCPECGVGCVESSTYDSRRAAFSGGESPSWYCEECQTHYVREGGDEGLTLDLYGRG